MAEETGNQEEVENKQEHTDTNDSGTTPIIQDTDAQTQNSGVVVDVDSNKDYTGNEVEFLNVEKPKNDETQEQGNGKETRQEVETGNQENNQEESEEVLKEDYKSKYEELKAKLEETQLSNSQSDVSEGVFANDYIKRLNALVKDKGEDVLNDPNFKFYQEFDESKVDLSDTGTALELLKRQMSIEHPHLSKSEIDDEVGEKYEPLINKDEYDESDSEYKRAKRSLKIEGAKAKNFLAEKSKDYQLPQLEEIQTATSKQPKLTPEQQQEIEKAEETYKNGVESFTSQISEKGINMNVKEFTKGAVETLSFKPSKEAIERTKQYMLEGRNDRFFNQFVQKDEQGRAVSVDADTMAEAITWSNDKAKIMKTLIDQGISIGKELNDQEYNNTDFKTGGDSGGGGNISRPKKVTDKDIMLSLSKQIKAAQRESGNSGA